LEWYGCYESEVNGRLPKDVTRLVVLGLGGNGQEGSRRRSQNSIISNVEIFNFAGSAGIPFDQLDHLG
jgi:hypothetical protein